MGQEDPSFNAGMERQTSDETALRLQTFAIRKTAVSKNENAAILQGQLVVVGEIPLCL